MPNPYGRKLYVRTLFRPMGHKPHGVNHDKLKPIGKFPGIVLKPRSIGKLSGIALSGGVTPCSTLFKLDTALSSDIVSCAAVPVHLRITPKPENHPNISDPVSREAAVWTDPARLSAPAASAAARGRRRRSI